MQIFGSVIVLVMVLGFLLPLRQVQAASLTNTKDVMSTETATANANHTISFISPSAITNGSTITLTFPAGFDLTGIIEDDIDIAGSTEGELTTAADCTGSEKAGIASPGAQVITINLCAADGGDFTGSETVTIEIGTNAASSGTGANRIDNPGVGAYKIAIGGTMTDAGSYAVSIIADDSVNITSTVNPTLTFAISDTAIGFGTLTTANARFATGDLVGADTTPTIAHTFSIATNATTGYSITYNGTTLTNADADTIDVATIASDDDGTPNSEQFAFGVTTNGDGTIVPAYDANSSAEYKFIAGATTPFFSELGATATETISAYYIANIAATTEAGTYTTDITYIATGTF